MEWSKKIYEPVVEFLQSLSPTMRLAAGTALVGVAVVAVFAYPYPGGGEFEYLFGARPFTDHELGMMEAALAEAGLQDWSREANRLRVPRREKASYLAALSAAGALPEQPGSAYDEVFRGSSLLDSRPVTDSKLRRASERSLASTICGLNGVYSASVKIEDLDRGGFPRRKELRAVATVRGDANRGLQRQQLVSIRDIVAHGGGVASENVVVVDVNSNRSYRGDQLFGPAPDGTGDPYLARQLAYEQATRKRIEDVLVMYPGAIISVHAEPMAARTAAHDANSAAEDTTDPSSRSPHESPGSPRDFAAPRATASILLPRSLFRQIWLQENVSPGVRSSREPDKRQLAEVEGRIIRDVQDAVAPLLPAPPGEDPTRNVTVRAFTPAAFPVAESHTASERAVAWLADNWTTLGLFGLAAFAMWLIRGLFRSNTNASAQTTPANQGGTADATMASAASPTIHSAENDDEPDLRRELTALIHADPERAANLMAEWLEDAA